MYDKTRIRNLVTKKATQPAVSYSQPNSETIEDRTWAAMIHGDYYVLIPIFVMNCKSKILTLTFNFGHHLDFYRDRLVNGLTIKSYSHRGPQPGNYDQDLTLSMSDAVPNKISSVSCPQKQLITLVLVLVWTRETPF